MAIIDVTRKGILLCRVFRDVVDVIEHLVMIALNSFMFPVRFY